MEVVFWDSVVAMEIPASVRILASIQPGSVFYFEDDQFSSPEPHYYVVLNHDPRALGLAILVVASSKVEKRKNIARRLGFPPETLVIVQPGEYPLFTVETVIDCNSVYDKSTQALIEKLENGKLGVCTEIMPTVIVEKLIQGVLASTRVSAQMQEMLCRE